MRWEWPTGKGAGLEGGSCGVMLGFGGGAIEVGRGLSGRGGALEVGGGCGKGGGANAEMGGASGGNGWGYRSGVFLWVNGGVGSRGGGKGGHD